MLSVPSGGDMDQVTPVLVPSTTAALKKNDCPGETVADAGVTRTEAARRSAKVIKNEVVMRASSLYLAGIRFSPYE